MELINLHYVLCVAVTNKPVYACDLCPAKCGRKTDLRKHIQKLHTAGKFYKYRHCEKHFQDQYSLNINIKVGILLTII